MPAVNKPVRIHCKAGYVSVRLVFETRGKCQDFTARYKYDSITYAINSPFSCTNTNIIVRQSKSIKDREIGKQFAPLSREYHCGKNNYSFDALQAYCFGINLKL